MLDLDGVDGDLDYLDRDLHVDRDVDDLDRDVDYLNRDLDVDRDLDYVDRDLSDLASLPSEPARRVCLSDRPLSFVSFC